VTGTLLEVRDVAFSYGPLQVLFGVSVDVGDGERVALLGTNGAGKSTLLKVVSGIAAPTSGSVRFDGVDITAASAQQRVELGLVQVAGGRATFPSLSVRENIRLGTYPFRRDKPAAARLVDDAIDAFPQLRDRLDQPAGLLSGGEQQMMALARALASRPRLLVIDELSLGLAPVVLGELLRVIDDLASRDMTMLIVEQSLNVSLTIAQRAYFMEKGEIRYEGPTADLLERGDLVRSVFFGTGG
jgi:branched-chain amino acid transport system ATP-binding protein